jgi:hypothetical protein
MKKTLLVLLLIMGTQISYSQVIRDFKTKNANNITDRTMMLDILRASLYQEYKQEFIFVVKHFKVSDSYAWFQGTAQRKDGKPIKFEYDGANTDYVTCLFKRSNGKWYIVESDAFGTDVWWYGIDSRYPAAPKKIFTAID